MNSGLFANEIDCLLSRILANTQLVHWLGVFARDELPDLRCVKRPSALILNSDPKDKPGQHWLAIFCPKKGPLELFDSFGFPPEYYSLDPHVFTHQQFSYQSRQSSYCSHYCIMIIYFRSIDLSYSEIIKNLNSSRSSNVDQLVHDLVYRIHSVCRTFYPCFPLGHCCTPNCVFC